MKIIFRLDTDDAEKINIFIRRLDECKETIVIPQEGGVKMWIVNDKGDVVELK